jgi:hypothetical protein
MSDHGIAKVCTSRNCVDRKLYPLLISCFDSLCSTKDNDDILKLVAREWRALTDRDRAQWDEEARNDKLR